MEVRFDYERSKYRDPFFAILFLLHLVAIVACAVMYSSYVNTTEIDTGDDDDIKPITFVIALAAAAAVGLGFGYVWLKIIQKYTKQIIYMSMIMSLGLLLVGAAATALAGAVVGALALLIMAAVTGLYYYCVRSRIPFTQAVIDASSTSIQNNSSLIGVTLGLALLQVAWVALWSYSTVGIISYLQEQSNSQGTELYEGANGVYFFFLLISLYWTSQVIKNVGHVTTSGAVASWWLLPSVASPVGPSFKRATTTSFGSICFGSLIVAVLSALRDVLKSLQNRNARDNSAGAACIYCMLACVVGCIERIMEYFNMYAYTQVAIYGKDFISAAKATLAMFRARGFDAIINDDLTGMVIMMGCLGGGVVGALAGGGAAFLLTVATDSRAVVIGASAGIGFLLGLLMVSLTMSVLQSAVATTFVLWAEAPNELGHNRPSYYNKLVQTAQARYPNRDW